MRYDLINDLRTEIAKGHVLVIVGSGVSIGATRGTPLASWTGLLKDGVERSVAIRKLDVSWSDSVKAEIHAGDMDTLLSAAEKVSGELGAPSGPEYRRWLRETVGTLKAKDRSVLEALRHLNLPLATTNYDGLLEEATGYPAITWRDGDRAIRVINGEEDGILHLHGYWEEPGSVVLGIRSYEQIVRDGYPQAVLRALRTLKTLLFVGCGEGLTDPNFVALFLWAREVFKDVGRRHYRLCKESELETLRALHQEDHLYPLSYGPDHSGLAPYLRGLRSFPSDSGMQGTAQTMRLPGRARCFGREGEVRDLVDTLLQLAPPPTPILGGPGMGKTTIALEALHDSAVAERFGSRRFFVRCDGTKSREALVREIVRTIGLKPGFDIEASLFEELERLPSVLVLDNAETPWEAAAAEVSELLFMLGSLNGLALVASIRGNQRPLGISWRAAIQVGPLELAAARDAFIVVAGEHLRADPDLDRLVEAVDRLTLAVVLLAHEAEGEPSLAGLWKRWQERKTALLKYAEDKAYNIEVSLEFSLRSLRMTSAAQRLLAVLAHLPDGVAHRDLEALMLDEGGAAASVLRKVGLAFDQRTRLRVLAPVREYIQKQFPAEVDDLGRTISHYLGFAAMGSLVGRMGGAEAAGKVTEELGNVEAMLLCGLAESNPEPTILGACQFGGFIRFTGLGNRTPLEKALSVALALDRNDLAGRCAERLGEIALYNSDHAAARALYEKALGLYQKTGDLEGETSCIKSLGNIALARSDHDAAGARFEEALLLYRRVGSVVGEANCIRSLGDIALERFDYDTARGLFEESFLLYKRVGDLRGQARSVQSLGDIALLHSDYDTARTCYEEAQSLNLQVGDVLGEAHCLLSLGDVAFGLSNYEAAGACYNEAVLIYRRLGGVLGEANCAQGLGNIALERSDYAAARARFEEALPLFRECGSILGEAHCIKSFGDIALFLADYAAARARYEEALTLYIRVHSILGEANCIQGLGDVARQQSELAMARAKFVEALRLYQGIREPYSIGEAHVRLARLALEGTEERQIHLRAARQAWESIKRPDLLGRLREEFGEILHG